MQTLANAIIGTLEGVVLWTLAIGGYVLLACAVGRYLDYRSRRKEKV